MPANSRWDLIQRLKGQLSINTDLHNCYRCSLLDKQNSDSALRADFEHFFSCKKIQGVFFKGRSARHRVTTGATFLHGSELYKTHPAWIIYVISHVFMVTMLTFFFKATAPFCCLLMRHLALHCAQPRRCRQKSQYTAAWWISSYFNLFMFPREMKRYFFCILTCFLSPGCREYSFCSRPRSPAATLCRHTATARYANAEKWQSQLNVNSICWTAKKKETRKLTMRIQKTKTDK